MSAPCFLHLLDDVAPGGMTRWLLHLETVRPECHAVETVGAAERLRPTERAAALVSHLALAPGRTAALAAAAAATGAALIHVEHAWCAGAAPRDAAGRARLVRRLRGCYRRFDRVVAVSGGQARWMLAEELVARDRLVVMRPSVDLAPFLALAPARGPARRFGAFGPLVARKGLDLLIRAFRALPDPALSLEIVGEGPARAALQALATGDPRIRFAGHAADPVAAMARIDALCAPATAEPYGLSVLEARAAGRLAIVSGVDGLADHVTAGALAAPFGPADGEAPAQEAWTAALACAAAGPADELRLARARAAAVEQGARSAGIWAALAGVCTPGGGGGCRAEVEPCASRAETPGAAAAAMPMTGGPATGGRLGGRGRLRSV